MPKVSADNATEAFRFISPVVKVSLSGTPTLIGTAFFITTTGVIVTAKHVILDNLDEHSNDIGGIGILCTFGPLAGTYRALRRSHWHPTADIAVSETAQFVDADGDYILNEVLALTVLPQLGDEPISTQFFHDSDLQPNRAIVSEQSNPMLSWDFEIDLAFRAAGPNTPQTTGTVHRFSPSARITRGALTRHYPAGRDRVMLPFPVFESNMPIYAGASGGPVFNTRGEVIAVNCTRIEGSDVSYHTDISCILDLIVENTFTQRDPVPRARSVRELAALQAVSISGL
jgi:hypothetical protein